ncbi:MAG: hypothetical protein ACI8QS_000422 [Planctomycetota bacterium]|jgi:uncharacterized protein YceH (UPF0502 family)
MLRKGKTWGCRALYSVAMSDLRLNTHEARALGVLIEKELTTPDQYPLSLNSLLLGCNQKSSRDPVTDFTMAEIVVTVQGLVAKHLAGRSSGGRVERYRHNANSRLGLSAPESAILAVLLLRGAQQPGELRTRISRLAPGESQEDVLRHLESLAGKELVRNIGQRPGSRAERWAQRLTPLEEQASSATITPSTASPTPIAPAPEPLAARVESLEERVLKLETLLADLGG